MNIRIAFAIALSGLIISCKEDPPSPAGVGLSATSTQTENPISSPPIPDNSSNGDQADAANVTKFGAKGDGATDDTAAIQRALNSNKVVFFPQPKVVYKVSGLQLNAGQVVVGPGKWIPCLQGTGTGVVLNAGTYPLPPGEISTIRQISIRGMRIANENYPAVAFLNSPDFSIVDSYLLSRNTNTLDIKMSYRGTIRENFIGQSGTGWAVSMMDYANATTISNNVITGGAAGNGIDVGRSQGVRILGNAIEVGGGYGIRVSGNPSAAYGGVSSGISIETNYLEQVKIPFSIGEHYIVRGLTLKDNIVGNKNVTEVKERVGFLVLGRATDIKIENNAYIGTGCEKDGLCEPGFVFRHLKEPGTYAVRSSIQNNDLQGIGENYQLFGFPNNDSVLGRFFSQNELRFSNSEQHGRLQEYVTPLLSASEAAGPIAFVPPGNPGMISEMEIIDATGIVDCTLHVGNEGTGVVSSEIFYGSLANIPFLTGRATLTLKQNMIRNDRAGLLRIFPTGSGNGSFRIRVSYRR